MWNGTASREDVDDYKTNVLNLLREIASDTKICANHLKTIDKEKNRSKLKRILLAPKSFIWQFCRFNIKKIIKLENKENGKHEK